MINSLPKIVKISSKRVGRGYGSGKGGHTVGRGQKGQKTRSKVSPLFEGTKIKKSFIQRLPFLRGRGRHTPTSRKPIIVTLGDLNVLENNVVVNLDLLLKKGIVDPKAKKVGVKLVGVGSTEKKFTLEIPATKKAMDAVK